MTFRLSLHDFQNWIQAHPAMIKFFNESFHQELWGKILILISGFIISAQRLNLSTQKIKSSLLAAATSSTKLLMFLT